MTHLLRNRARAPREGSAAADGRRRCVRRRARVGRRRRGRLGWRFWTLDAAGAARRV